MQVGSYAIAADGLGKVWKSFRRTTRALDNLTLHVSEGSAFGLLGPNGAGKTTFVKMLTGAVRPTSGSATVFGHPAGSTKARAMLGYVPDHHSESLHLTASQWIDFQCTLYGLDRERRRRRTAELLDQVAMTRWADVPLRTYSRGMRRRVCIAAALAHEPRLLILDEPTDGLDPTGRRDLLELLRHLNVDHGVTLLVNSHQLREIEGLCSEIALINEGLLVRSGTLESLTAGDGYTVVLGRASQDMDSVFGSRGIRARREPSGMLNLQLQSREELDWALEYARENAASIETLLRSTVTLEDVYLAETRHSQETPL